MIHNRARLIAHTEEHLLAIHRTSKDYYYLPGGHIEEGEDMKAAIIREAEEEVGMKITSENLKLIYVMEFIKEEVHSLEYIFSYKFTNLDKFEGIADPGRPTHIAKLLDINKLPNNLYPEYLKENLLKDLVKGELLLIS
jgi:8-oxo-dGTP pyrophosphatase MutT (NUDIX family)